MSTRSTTWFVDAGGRFAPVEGRPLADYDVAARVYRHSDGYPEGHGKELHEFFAAIEAQTRDTRYGDPSYLAAKLVVYLAREFASDYDPERGEFVSHAETRPLDFLSVGVCQHDPGDIEYVYVIDCGTRAERPRVTCYAVSGGWDVGAGGDSFLGTEQEIPTPERARLEELRAALRAENISWGELAELQDLAPYIADDDAELREAAGLPEFAEEV